jgi:hypothetical protein
VKFENIYPDTKTNEIIQTEYHLRKDSKIAECACCGAMTRWFDLSFDSYMCSEECCKDVYFDERFKNIKEELKLSLMFDDEWKDIIIVVKDQLYYFKQCVESIQKFTNKYHLYIWDNGSGIETQKYIENLIASVELKEDSNVRITICRSEENTGFIFPNNELIALGESPYVILLNSDTKVSENWDNVMIGFLKSNQDVSQVGYLGGILNEDGRGDRGGYGYEVDYIQGWCFCINRKTYEKYGLFNEELKFAYCEDSDFSLRLKQSGNKIYSLYSSLVHHYQNKTVIAVEKENVINMGETFNGNHEYLKNKWKDYLENDRVSLKGASI